MVRVSVIHVIEMLCDAGTAGTTGRSAASRLQVEWQIWAAELGERCLPLTWFTSFSYLRLIPLPHFLVELDHVEEVRGEDKLPGSDRVAPGSGIKRGQLVGSDGLRAKICGEVCGLEIGPEPE